MPIGKYIYCTPKNPVLESWKGVTNAYRQVHLLYVYKSSVWGIEVVTNAYRQVHLLYRHTCQTGSAVCVTNAYRQVHLLYEAFKWRAVGAVGSQMPIGKYIYCTPVFKKERIYYAVTNAYRQVHLLYPSPYPPLWKKVVRSQMPIGKYIYCTLIWKSY